MNFLRVPLIAMVSWVFLGSVSVDAKPHDHQTQHQTQASSPFESKKDRVSLHCLLKIHAQRSFCPHSISMSSKNIPVSIASDCGGKNSEGTLNTLLFNYDFTQVIPIALPPNDLKSGFIFDQFVLRHRLKDTILPPPKII